MKTTQEILNAYNRKHSNLYDNCLLPPDAIMYKKELSFFLKHKWFSEKEIMKIIDERGLLEHYDEDIREDILKELFGDKT